MNLVLGLLLFLSSLSTSSSALDPHDLLPLPRPLILEYPLASSDDDVIRSSSSSYSDFFGGAPVDEEELQMRCASWRFAGEANNLAPWRTVPLECAGYVKDYVIGKAYRYDLEMVAAESATYARSIRLSGDDSEAWVFDVDETLLSNLPYYAEHHYGLEVFDGHEFDKWVEKAIAPAIESSLKLYEEILNLGFKVFLLTGRSEGHKSVTVDNLIKVGFRNWEKLILRGLNDRGKPATIYKSEKRDELVNQGYRILGNSGDQWSDLLGSSASNRSFKLPNPMYYIP